MPPFLSDRSSAFELKVFDGFVFSSMGFPLLRSG